MIKKSSELRIALIQTDLFWENKIANLDLLEKKIIGLKNSCDLVLLPEMFSTGFSMQASFLSEPMNGTVHNWMKNLAYNINAVITGSVIIFENGKYYNRLLWVQPNGNSYFYDKRHLFRMSNEHMIFVKGTNLPFFLVNGWKICPQICYDLRFPVWSRNRWEYGKASYDLLFYIASWPASRISIWDSLLPARAIENLSYCLGVNRIGIDGNNLAYNGHSAAYNFNGEKLIDLGEKSQIQVLTLLAKNLDEYRKKFNSWLDVDSFLLEN